MTGRKDIEFKTLQRYANLKLTKGTKRVYFYCSVCGIEVNRSNKYCPECRKEYAVRIAGRVDKNQKDIMDALTQVGASVWDLSMVGRGCPDLIIAYQGKDYLIEVKNPENAYGRKGFNKNQQKFVDEWRGGKIYLVRSVEDALKVIGVKT